MSILSDKQIVARLGDSVIIDPFVPANVNTSSYDVTLGEWFFIEHKPSLWSRIKHERQIYNIWDLAHIKRVWGEPILSKQAKDAMPGMRYRAVGNWFEWSSPWWGIRPDDAVILIPPKHTILAHTREFIGGRVSASLTALPSTTMMKARSSFGRNFIEVCKCAGYGDVGYTNRWTMEITNNSRFYHIPLIVGRRIAQIVFMETGEIEGRDYAVGGKYQSGSNIVELRKAWTPYMMLPRLDQDRDIKRAA